MFNKIILIIAILPAVVYSQYNATVAADGSGNYKTVEEAINKAPGTSRWTIYIKSGTYKEELKVNKNMVHLVGEDENKVILTYNLKHTDKDKNGNEVGTTGSASVHVTGDDFIAEKITFQNSAGQTAGQAVAILIDSKKGVFKNCKFDGWQDTLYVKNGHFYFGDCYIEGSVDFIFGDATAFFDKCHVYGRANGTLTAANTAQGTKYGLVFSHCTIDGASGATGYLGRPWGDYASTYFLYSSMTNVIRPAGWEEWSGEPQRDKTVRYYEYGNTGSGFDAKSRVTWSHELTKAEADALTVQTVLGYTP